MRLRSLLLSRCCCSARRAGAGGARTGAQAGRFAAQLLLARAVYSAADDRSVERRIHARWQGAGHLQHGGLAVAAGDRLGRSGRADPSRAALTTISPTWPPMAGASCSPDMTADAFELWRRRSAQRARGAADSRRSGQLEPRLSPDGKRIAWVSTKGTGHFNLFIADIGPDGLTQRASAARRAQKRDPPLLLFGLRSCAEPVVDARRQAHPLRRQPRGRVGHAATSGRWRSTIRPTDARSVSEETSLERAARSCRRTASGSSSRAITAGSGGSYG